MACNKFEETGLLYLSGELDEGEARGYEAHISACEECRGETELYRAESVGLYTAEVLGEVPRREVSDEIMRVCSDPRRAAAATVLTPLLFLRKYAPVPIFLMLAMVAVGGYVKYHSMAAEGLRARLEVEEPAREERVAEGVEQGAQGVRPDGGAGEGDKLALSDSAVAAGDSNAAFSKTRGSLDVEGVVPVSRGEVAK